MPWPLSQDYNEALQNPQTSFNDPELRQGQVVVNALGIPQPCSGNFADVYAVECAASKTKWAVKCFTREVHGLRERYSEISSYLQKARLPFTVDFQYLEQGIRIAGRWYPILKMHWVEGATLNAFVRNMLDKPVMLEKLSRIWVRMAHRLREAKLTHCDLQHGNVLLVPDSEANALAVKLIDYDGMWVPALAKTPSGEFGHCAYQHPRRLHDSIYNAEVDRFPLLAIHVALRALIAGGKQLWERYDTGDNLLFRQGDFEAPTKSPLFAELLRMNQPDIGDLSAKLIDAARMPLDKTPHLADLVADEKPSKSPTSRSRIRQLAAPARGANPFEDLESGRARRKRSGAHLPWIMAGSIAACAVVGGAILWSLQAGGSSNTPSTQPALAQTKSEATTPTPKGQELPPPKEKQPLAQVDKEDLPPEDLPKMNGLPPKQRPQTSNPPPHADMPASAPEEKKVLPLPDAARTAKESVPSADARRKATQDIREVYKTEIAEIQKADDRLALAVKLLRRGTDKSEDPVHRYVYLCEARDQAARGGDAELSLSAIDELTQKFAVAPLPMKTAALELAAKAPQKPEATKKLLEQILAIADEAESADEYEPAARLLKIALFTANKSGDPYVRGTIAQRETRLNSIRTGYAKIADAIKTLAGKADDAAANLTVGKFQCFVKEDWSKGLPMLARSQNAVLAELARKEAEEPAAADEQAALGRAWGAFADKQINAIIRNAARKRAKHWLYAALPSLKGAAADRIASQLEVKGKSFKLRPGLIVELFKQQAFEKRIKARLDYTVDFDWGEGRPDTKLPADNFSIRWQGVLIPPRAGKYRLSLEHDDGARLKINGLTLIDHWGQPGIDSKEIPLKAQPYEIQLEMHDIGAQASMHLRWSLIGGFKEQAIPADALFHEIKEERSLTP